MSIEQAGAELRRLLSNRLGYAYPRKCPKSRPNSKPTPGPSTTSRPCPRSWSLCGCSGRGGRHRAGDRGGRFAAEPGLPADRSAAGLRTVKQQRRAHRAPGQRALAALRRSGHGTDAAADRFGISRMKHLINFVASTCSSRRPIADAGTNAAVAASSSWPCANSAPSAITLDSCSPASMRQI
jgi:hypothetical protein